MRGKDFLNEGALTSTPKDLDVVREWMLQNNFTCDPVTESPQTKWDQTAQRHERAIAGFVGVYHGKKGLFKNKYVGVYLQRSKYEKRNILLLSLSDYIWEELHSPNDVIRLIKKYYKI